MKIEVKKTLESIYVRDGALDPAVIVNEAANPNSPLHDCFDWNDAAAAHQYRLDQARNLIRLAVTIIPAVSNGPVRQFISVSSMRGGETGSYLATVDVLSDRQRYEQALADAITSMVGMEKRYRHLQELKPVFEAIAMVAATHQAAKAA